MPSYHVSVSISAGPEDVWRTLAAVAKWPEWLPTVTSVEPLDSETLTLGARYRIAQPKLRPATLVVTNVEPNRRFVLESRSLGATVIADHVIDEPSPGTSNVVLRVSFSGVFGVPIGWFLRSLTKSYIAQEAAAIKSRVESEKAKQISS